MKIGNVKDPAAELIQQYQRSENISQTADIKQAGAFLPAETVNLSAKSKELQQIKNAVDNVPEVRENIVEKLKSQIKDGTYKINSEKIAEKMIHESIIDIFA